MTRGEMKTRFKSIVDDVSDNVFDDARIEDLLYEGAQAVQNELELRDSSLFTYVDTQSITSGTLTIDLPTGCGRVLSIKRTDTVSPVKFNKVNFVDLETRNCEKYYYAVMGNTVYYSRDIAEDHTVKIYYSKVIDDLENDDTSWDLIPVQAHALIPYEAALLALASEESAIKGIGELYAKRKDNILALFSPRDVSEVRTVRMVY